MIKVSAPGNLFLAGEWAVLDSCNSGIVMALDKNIFAEIKSSPDKNIYITLENFGINSLPAVFKQGKLYFKKKITETEQKNILFTKKAIETIIEYLGKWRYFQIRLWSSETGAKKNSAIKKLGFGFSAALTVAIVSGLLKFHGVDMKSRKVKDRIFKLSALSHYFAQDKVGSGFDIAASTYGGMFIYKRFDGNWLQQEKERNKTIWQIVENQWPGFFIKRLKIPKKFHLMVGWTKKSSSTSQMIKVFNKWKRKHQRECKRLFYQINDLVKALAHSLKLEKKKEILTLLNKNERYLKKLGEKSNVNIETRELKKLSAIADKEGAAGKLSGAGGGDCGIAVCFDKKAAKKIEQKWKKNGIQPIDVKISASGVKVSDFR